MQDIAQLGHGVLQRETDFFQHQLAGLDFGDIKNIVDDAEQGARRGFDFKQVVPLAGAVRRIQRQLRVAQYGSKRGADFVAHIGQEVAFGAGGSL